MPPPMHIVIAERQKGGTSMFPQQPMRNMAQQGRPLMNPRMRMGGRPSLPGRQLMQQGRQLFPQQQIAGAGLRNAGTGGGGA